MSANHSTTRAALYFRMSTLKQEDSIDRQRSQVLPHAQKKGYHVVREYADEGIAGDEIAKRKQFQAMLRDAQAGAFDVILCDDKDRFGRFDSIDLGEIVAPLRRKGVILETVAQGLVDWNSFAGRITDAVLQEAKRLEQDALSRRVLTGQLLKATQGKPNGGPPPYGYAWALNGQGGKRPVPDERRAEVIRFAFQFIDGGGTLGGLSHELYRRGVPSPTGRPRWPRHTLFKTLINRKYVGDWTWGVRSNGKRHKIAAGAVRAKGPADRRFAANAPDDWIVTPEHHEALIDRDLFSRVLARLKGNRKRTTPHVNGGPFVLSRLLVCGHCGEFLRGATWRGTRAYTCGGYVAHGKGYCNRNLIHEDKLLRLLLRKLKDAFLNPEHLARLREKIAEAARERRGEDNIGRLNREAAALEKKIHKGNENLALLPADVIPGVVAQVREWTARREEIKAELHRIEHESPADALEQVIAAAEAELWRLEEALTAEDDVLLRKVLQETIGHVELFWTHRETRRTTRTAFLRGIVHLKQHGQLSCLSTALECGGS